MKKKTKVERILSDGDLVLNLADDNLQQEAVKENLIVSMPEKKIRKSRKKAELKITEMSVVQEIIVDNSIVATKIEHRFADLMPDHVNEMNFSMSEKKESYQNSDASLVTNESNQLNYNNNNNNNNTYFYDELGNRIECELMNEEDLVVIDLPVDMPSVIATDSSFNHIEPSTDMDQNYNCDASDDGSVRSFQTVFYSENGVNHDPEPMDIEMNEEIVNVQKEEHQEGLKVQKHGHRRVLIDEEDEEVMEEQENEHQELLHKLPKVENVMKSENVVLEYKSNIKTEAILDTTISIGVKEEVLTQPWIHIIEAEAAAKDMAEDVAEYHENMVETELLHSGSNEEDNVEYYQQPTEDEMVTAIPKFEQTNLNTSISTEDYYQLETEEIVVPSELSSQDTTAQEIAEQDTIPVSSWDTGEYYQPTNDSELPAHNLNTSWHEYYQTTNDPEVQQKMNVLEVPCTSSAVQEEEYEDLMKSIDFNSLVLAESQVDGKTVNELYTMDSITEEISEKPLNLPQHVVDKIVSILNNADSDDEDA